MKNFTCSVCGKKERAKSFIPKGWKLILVFSEQKIFCRVECQKRFNKIEFNK